VFGDGTTAVRGGFGISVLPQTQINTNLQNQPPNNYTPKTYYGTLTSFLNTAGTLFPSNPFSANRCSRSAIFGNPARQPLQLAFYKLQKCV
jgi:hypothetical protein